MERNIWITRSFYRQTESWTGGLSEADLSSDLQEVHEGNEEMPKKRMCSLVM